MKIFRYKLRNGNFILISHKKAQEAQKEKNLFLFFYVTFVPFCGSFSFCCGAVDVADAADGLDSFETIELVAQLLAQVTDVHVDAAIEG